MFDEIALLEASGHEVGHFSSAHPENIASPWSGTFVPYLELGSGGQLSASQKVLAASRMFSNIEAARRFAAVIQDFRPDVVHVHGIHRQLSPSILLAARAAGVPVVQTLHDYHHICPADVLLRGGTDVCNPRRCGTFWYGPAMSNRCVHESRAASVLSSAETSFQRLRRVYEKTIARFISPSEFLAQAIADGGWATPCDVIPNAVPLSACASGGGYVLFAGRLSPEKGVDTFLAAAKAAGVQALVAGEGPLESDLRRRFPEVEFRGRVDGPTVQSLIQGSLACVVPSTWYENAPMSVLEPMAAGVPVVASRIGGIPEIIEDGVSGILVRPGDVSELAAALVRLSTDIAFATRLGSSGRERIAARFLPADHLRRLLETYDAARLS
jgi:glycosyltransferase involved in cell wall biosynthesis